MRVGPPGAERPVVSTDGAAWRDARAICADFDDAFFAADGPGRLRSSLDAGLLPTTSVDGERIGAPVQRVGSIVCIGMNYAAHAAESGSPRPDEIVVFYKKPNALTGPKDPVAIPHPQSKLDWEVELGIVVGASLYGDVTRSQAMEAVAGYVLANDLSDRWLQIERSGGQWSKGKSFPGSCTLGPWILTCEDVPEPQTLRMRSWVNGEVRQDSTSGDMVFGVCEILVELAQVMRLEPGDLILTGTPEGVALSGRFPYLAPGDVIRMTIEGLGEIEQRVTEHRTTARREKELT